MQNKFALCKKLNIADYPLIEPHQWLVISELMASFTSLKLKQFQKFDSAATALEEVAALVEGKVTPRLASLLDSLKDEKRVSLAVADPKLGMGRVSPHCTNLALINDRKRYQQTTTIIYHPYFRCRNCGTIPIDSKPFAITHPRSTSVRPFHYVARPIALAIKTQA